MKSQKTNLIVVGVSHKTAPIRFREKLAISKDDLLGAMNDLKRMAGHQESVLLSTCNRVEVYARPHSLDAKSIGSLHDFFKKRLPHKSLKPAIYQKSSEEAVRHLFRVACGLDSMVVGETEILGQVKSAYLSAQKEKMTGKVTNVLFQRALFVGKKVRSQTSISSGVSSVGSVAVRLAERIFGPLQNHRVLILGAGKMAGVAACHLACQKVEGITILNRSLSKAQELAKLLNADAGTLRGLKQGLVEADIVVCSLSVKAPIVTREMMDPLLPQRQGRPLYFIDVAVPRNIDERLRELPHVHLYNIDDLKEIVNENIDSRRKVVRDVENMVRKSALESYAWVRANLNGHRHPLRHTHQH